MNINYGIGCIFATTQQLQHVLSNCYSEDFHITACMALLKLALDMYNPARENPLHPSEVHAPSDANNTPADEPPRDEQDAEAIVTPESSTLDDARQHHDPDIKDRVLGMVDAGSDPLAFDSATSDGRPEVQVADTRDVVEENSTQCAADIDDVDDKVITAKTGQVKGGSTYEGHGRFWVEFRGQDQICLNLEVRSEGHG